MSHDLPNPIAVHSDGTATGPGWVLHLGDCLQGLSALADKSIDVTISDPPYEQEAHSLQRRQLGKTRRPGGNQEYRAVLDSALDFHPITAKQRTKAAAEIARVTRHCALVFCQVEAVADWKRAFNTAGMPYRRCMPWNKPDAMPSLHGRWPGQEFEAIVLAVHSSARPCPIGGKAIEYRSTRERGAGNANAGDAPHPTTKPLTLMRSLVEHFSLPGDLVLDCFAGSGTTGVACRQRNRRFVGWEIDENHFATACRRLRGDEAKPRLEQPQLLDWRAS